MTLDYDAARHVVLVSGPGTFELREVLRAQGGKFDAATKGWMFPVDALKNGLVGVLTVRGAKCCLSTQLSDLMLQNRCAQEVRLGKSVLPITYNCNTKPYDHQRHGTAWLISSHRAMLLDEMGLGKTKEAIDAAGYLKMPVLVVCPNSVRRTWEQQIGEHAVGEPEVCVLEGSSKQRLEQLVNTRAPWVIANYETLLWLEKTEPGVLAEWVKQRIVVFDEATRLKSGMAKVTKLVMSWSPKRIWLLTGTPIANRPEDLYSLISLVRPGYVGWSWYQFERRHIIRGHFNEIKSYKNLDELRDKLADVSLGRKKEDCLDLPEKIYSTIRCELSDSERKAYQQMHDTLVAWIEEQGLEPGQRPTIAQATTFATRYMRLRQLVDGLVSEGAGMAHQWSKELTKLRAAVETWDDAGRPRAVIWYQWVPVGHKLEELFLAEDPRVFRIGGDVPIENRNRLIAQWQEWSGVLIGQMAVAGEGLNLQAADWEMFVDLPTTPKTRRQCVDRLHRIGQRNVVRIVDLVADKTVDQAVLKTLEKKLAIADDIESAAYGVGTEWESMTKW